MWLGFSSYDMVSSWVKKKTKLKIGKQNRFVCEDDLTGNFDFIFQYNIYIYNKTRINVKCNQPIRFWYLYFLSFASYLFFDICFVLFLFILYYLSIVYTLYYTYIKRNVPLPTSNINLFVIMDYLSLYITLKLNQMHLKLGYTVFDNIWIDFCFNNENIDLFVVVVVFYSIGR